MSCVESGFPASGQITVRWSYGKSTLSLGGNVVGSGVIPPPDDWNPEVHNLIKRSGDARLSLMSEPYFHRGPNHVLLQRAVGFRLDQP